MNTNACGIYKITNIITGDYYIGSSVNMHRRFLQHRRYLERGIHDSHHLQNSWNKHGAQCFVFEAVLLCDIESKLYYEQVFLDSLKPIYNYAKNAQSPNIGRTLSENTKHKISVANKGKKRTEAMNRETSKRMKLYWDQTIDISCSKETKRKMSEAQKGKVVSEETRRKMSETMTGTGNHFFGKHHSEETLAKMRAAAKAHICLEESRAKQRGENNHFFGKHHSEETLAKMRGRTLTADTRHKMSEAKKAYWAERKGNI